MSSPQNPLDLSVAITTPENIRFEYRIAGPFRRAGAQVLDVLIRYMIVGGVMLILGFSGVFRLIPGIQSVGLAMFMVLSFLMTWFYGSFFEATWNGQTPGKRLMGLRVMSVDGRPINAVQATLRNFVRVADTMPLASLEVFGAEIAAYVMPTFLVGLVSMIVTQRMQRLGDLAAGTMVVLDERYWYPRRAKLEDPRIASLASYIPASFHMSQSMARVVALFIDRRAMLSGPRREELAKLLAVPLLAKFGFRPDTSADLLLCALYHRDFIVQDSSESAAHYHGPSPMAVSAPSLDLEGSHL